MYIVFCTLESVLTSAFWLKQAILAQMPHSSYKHSIPQHVYVEMNIFPLQQIIMHANMHSICFRFR